MTIMHRNHILTVKALKTSDNSVVVVRLMGNCGLNSGFDYVLDQFKMYDSPFLVRYLDSGEGRRGCQVWTRELCHRLGCDGVL